MSLTAEQIKNVLGTSRRRNTILTQEMKDTILEMVNEEEGVTVDSITSYIQENYEGGDKVKKEHVRNFLKRQLKKGE